MYTKLKLYIQFMIFLFILRIGIDKSNRSVLDLIHSDVFRFYGKNNTEYLLKGLLENPGLLFLFFFRLASKRPQNCIRQKVHNFSYYFFRIYFYKYGFQIPIETKIGRGFQILHFGRIIINPRAVIGKNCTINPGVLIGQNNRGVPVVGNQVWIGANAILVGDIVIGDNVVIAPGAYVNVNIPDNSLVIGNPCQVYSKTKSIVDGYIVNQVS